MHATVSDLSVFSASGMSMHIYLFTYHLHIFEYISRFSPAETPIDAELVNHTKNWLVSDCCDKYETTVQQRQWRGRNWVDEKGVDFRPSQFWRYVQLVAELDHVCFTLPNGRRLVSVWQAALPAGLRVMEVSWLGDEHQRRGDDRHGTISDQRRMAYQQ